MSTIEPSGPNRPFSQVMREAEKAERRLKESHRPKSLHRKPDRRPPWPEGWRSLTRQECERNATLWPKEGQAVMVPFPTEWREGLIAERRKDGYLVILNRGNGRVTCTLSQILVRA